MDDTIYNLDLQLTNDKEALVLIEEKLQKLKTLLSLSDEEFFNLMIAITEGINNAISHGNKYNVNKKVLFSVSANQEEINVTIHDEGVGFNPEDVPDPRAPENVMKDSGRGIFIIKSLMSEVSYDFSHGTTLIFKYKIKSK